MLSSRTRRTSNRAASLLRLAAVSVGRTDTALGAFYRRLAARAGKAKAITATARKIAVPVPQYASARYVLMSIPARALLRGPLQATRRSNLQRRAKSLGYVLHQADRDPIEAVS